MVLCLKLQIKFFKLLHHLFLQCRRAIDGNRTRDFLAHNQMPYHLATTAIFGIVRPALLLGDSLLLLYPWNVLVNRARFRHFTC